MILAVAGNAATTGIVSVTVMSLGMGVQLLSGAVMALFGFFMGLGYL